MIKKISELEELLTINNNDVIPIVDTTNGKTKKVLLYTEDNIFTQYNNLKYRYIKNLLITYNKMLFNCKYNKEVENFIKKEILNFYDKNNFNIIENIQIKLFLNESCLYKLFFSKRYEVIK